MLTFTVKPEHWEAAENFFKDNPGAVKFSLKKFLKDPEKEKIFDKYPEKPIRPKYKFLVDPKDKEAFEKADEALKKQLAIQADEAFEKELEIYEKKLKEYKKMKEAFPSFIKIEGQIYAYSPHIGKGNIGKIKKAMTKEGQEVALKIVTPPDDIEKSNNIRSSEIMQSIGYLKGYAERETPDGVVKQYFVTELRKGQDLAKAIYDNPEARLSGEALVRKPLSRKDNLLIALKCCVAIKAHHDKGVIHCDIKPDNFMIDRNKEKNSITIDAIDYDLAKQLDKGKEYIESDSAGTPPYEAPEIEKPKNSERPRYSKASDIYALGIMFKDDLQLDPKLYEKMIQDNPEKRQPLDEVIASLCKELRQQEQLEDADKQAIYDAQSAILTVEPSFLPKSFFSSKKIDITATLEKAAEKADLGIIVKFTPEAQKAIDSMVTQEKRERARWGLFKREVDSSNMKLLKKILKARQEHIDSLKELLPRVGASSSLSLPADSTPSAAAPKKENVSKFTPDVPTLVSPSGVSDRINRMLLKRIANSESPVSATPSQSAPSAPPASPAIPLRRTPPVPSAAAIPPLAAQPVLPASGSPQGFPAGNRTYLPHKDKIAASVPSRSVLMAQGVINVEDVHKILKAEIAAQKVKEPNVTASNLLDCSLSGKELTLKIEGEDGAPKKAILQQEDGILTGKIMGKPDSNTIIELCRAAMMKADENTVFSVPKNISDREAIIKGLVEARQERINAKEFEDNPPHIEGVDPPAPSQIARPQ